MKATFFFAVLIIGTLLSSSKTVVARKDLSVCSDCKPVINVSVDGNGQCDLCKITGELHQEMKKLKSELSTVKNQLREIQPVCNAPRTVALMFPKASTTDYVIKYGMPSLTSVTASFWMKSTDQVNLGTPLSYAVAGHYNEFLIDGYRSFHLYLTPFVRPTNVSAVDGNWHHICVTWENEFGSWALYKDGVMETMGQPLADRGHVIRGGGALVLGQEQDALGGGFDATQSFIGELTGVNIWDHVIDATEIANLAKSCSAGEGNVFKWSDFIPHVRGEVQLITSTCQA